MSRGTEHTRYQPHSHSGSPGYDSYRVATIAIITLVKYKLTCRATPTFCTDKLKIRNY